MTAIVFRLNLLSKEGQEDFADLKRLHNRAVNTGPAGSQALERLDTALKGFYNEISENRHFRPVAERRILEMKEAVAAYIFTGRCTI